MRTWAIIFGIFFLLLGILGFIPAWFVQGLLLSLFETGMWLNILYLVTGVFGLFVSLFSRRVMRLYFQAFGIFYAIIGIGGFIFLHREKLFFLANNSNNTWLSILTAAIALILGFGYRSKNERT